MPSQAVRSSFQWASRTATPVSSRMVSRPARDTTRSTAQPAANSPRRTAEAYGVPEAPDTPTIHGAVLAGGAQVEAAAQQPDRHADDPGRPGTGQRAGHGPPRTDRADQLGQGQNRVREVGEPLAVRIDHQRYQRQRGQGQAE